MLFITNRAINEPLELVLDRKISFAKENNQSGQSIHFCRRNAQDDYTEIGGQAMLDELRASPAKQILIYIHGFNNQPESAIFPRTETLQKLFDDAESNLVKVVPLVWPCNDQIGVIRDYFDDQDAADASSFAFARLLEKFLAWQASKSEDTQCLKRINILAHSMGNRVLRGTLQRWSTYKRQGQTPLLFRNTFMAAADIVNESLDRDGEGSSICQASRNVVVYFASDDLALRSSKVANTANAIASRRLGHTGPENPSLTPGNVYMVDCDDINTRYDPPKGHSYFMDDHQGGPGKLFQHMLAAIQTGRVQLDDAERRVAVLS